MTIWGAVAHVAKRVRGDVGRGEGLRMLGEEHGIDTAADVRAA